MLAALEHDDTDSGAKSAGTERLCIVTRTVRPTGDLIRFVTAPNGAVTPDLKQKLPGRGVWVSAQRQRSPMRSSAERLRRGFKKPIG